MNTPRELTLDDLVDRLGHSADWWKREVRNRKHPHLRVGREIRFTEDDYRAIRESYRPSEASVPVEELDPLRSQTGLSRRRSS
jgi:hypothetical protein